MDTQYVYKTLYMPLKQSGEQTNLFELQEFDTTNSSFHARLQTVNFLHFYHDLIINRKLRLFQNCNSQQTINTTPVTFKNKSEQTNSLKKEVNTPGLPPDFPHQETYYFFVRDYVVSTVIRNSAILSITTSIFLINL